MLSLKRSIFLPDLDKYNEWNKSHSSYTCADSAIHVVLWSDMAGSDDRSRPRGHSGLDMSLGIRIR